MSSYIFGNVRKSSENRRKSSEVARTFSEIPVMTRQKSHAFDSEKVGRYSISQAASLCKHLTDLPADFFELICSISRLEFQKFLMIDH